MKYSHLRSSRYSCSVKSNVSADRGIILNQVRATIERIAKQLTNRSCLVYYGLLILVLLSGLGMGGEEPVFLESAADIRSTSRNVDKIDIRSLPIEAYPMLAKFTNVHQVRLFNRDGRSTTNEKLNALAALSFTNLVDINLLNAGLVTDEGLLSLSRISSLRTLQLEGTGITDLGCEIMASRMKLVGVNVANCRMVTLSGIKSLASSETCKSLGFSAGNLTTKQVIDLVELSKSLNWCIVVDPLGKIDTNAVETAAKDKNLQIFVRKTGAMQDQQLSDVAPPRKPKDAR